jgi:DNA-directed RNA polymerase specialized sigma24 family protein
LPVLPAMSLQVALSVRVPSPDETLLVELRFFGGLSIEETARVLEVSPGTVMRDWTLAKVWLQREITAGSGGL